MPLSSSPGSTPSPWTMTAPLADPTDARYQAIFDYVQAACEAYHDATAIRDDAEAGESMAGAIAEAATAIEALPVPHVADPLPF